MDATLTVAGLDIGLPWISLGVIVGMTYGILAVGLVLVFRTNRIINFAHGEIGAFGAAVFGIAATKWSVPYWVAFPGALALSASVSALAEVAVIRRLRDAPRLMSIVATLGVGQFLLLFSIVVNNEARAGQLFPQPAFLPTFNIGALKVTQSHFAMLVLTPLLVVAIAAFLKYHRFGLAMRASAANPDATRMTGAFASRMSTLAWALAGAVSAFTAILYSPTKGFVAAESFGPGLLLRALVAAVIARMTSLPIALGAGVGIGVVEHVLIQNYPRGGHVEAVLFAAILITLLLRRQVGSAREEVKGSWAAVEPWPPLAEGLTNVWSIRNLGRIVAGMSVAIAVALPLVISNTHAVTLTTIIAFSIVGLSVGIVTGLGGQLSLGQFAIAAVGATISAKVAISTGNYPLALGAAAAVSAAVSVLIGLPALRLRGLMLAVTTLSFALATSLWLLQQPWMLGEGVGPGRPVIGTFALDTGKRYYFFALAMLLLAAWLTRNIRRGGVGRQLVAVRDNEDNARAFAVHTTRVKLQGFALAGAIAGLGGAVFGHSFTRISSSTFPVDASINAVAMTVIGGIGVLAGPIIGALYIIGIPKFLPLDAAGLAATSAGWLLLILYVPGGVAMLVRPLRDRLTNWLAARGGVTTDGPAPEPDGRVTLGTRVQVSQRVAPSVDATGPILVATDLVKHYGGVRAVDGVSLTVNPGEILGLIGPNGAGKTTLFELLGGFTRLDRGAIAYGGVDITRLGPEARAERGLIRSFQDAALFPTMTVLDAIRLAQERTDPTRLVPATLGAMKSERAKDGRARELTAAMGLDGYRAQPIRALSTGTRRIAEIACLVALEPELLLLDEPSSGIAQRETEALGGVLRELRSALDVTMIVIEHDIPLIMGLSDRVIAMESGRIIAQGDPATVRTDPEVVRAYLGGDADAIARSGIKTPDAGPTAALERLLAAVPGLGPKRRAALSSSFSSLDALRAATHDDLCALPGVGDQLALRILDALASNDRGARVRR